MRNLYHRYDLPHNERDDRQACGLVALLILAGVAAVTLITVVTLIARLLATALVVVQ